MYSGSMSIYEGPYTDILFPSARWSPTRPPGQPDFFLRPFQTFPSTKLIRSGHFLEDEIWKFQNPVQYLARSMLGLKGYRSAILLSWPHPVDDQPHFLLNSSIRPRKLAIVSLLLAGRSNVENVGTSGSSGGRPELAWQLCVCGLDMYNTYRHKFQL